MNKKFNKIMHDCKKIFAGAGIAVMTLSAMVTPVTYAAPAPTAGKYTINISAPESAGAKMDGAVYQLLKTKSIDATGKPTDLKPVEVLGDVTLQNGKAQAKVDEKGVYQLKPIKRAPGYLLDVREDGKLAQVQFPLIEDGKEAASQVFEMSTKDRPIHIDAEFIKYGDNEKDPLESVTFTLKQTHAPKTIGDNNEVTEWQELKDGEGITQQKTTGVDGKFVYENLPEGKYQIEEVTTKDGYELNKNINTFTVTQEGNQPVIKDNTVTEVAKLVNYKSPEIEKKIINNENKEVDDYTLNVEENYNYVLKVKIPTDIKTYDVFKINDVLNDNLKLLGIEKIEVFNESLETVQVDSKKALTLDKDAISKVNGNRLDVDFASVLDQLIPGGTIKVYVNSKILGTSIQVATVPNGFDLEYNNGKGHEPDKTIHSNVVNVHPHRGSIEFEKVDKQGAKLDGAVFRIVKAGTVNSVSEAQRATAVTNPLTGKPFDDVTTGKDGLVKFENLPYADYEIWEIKAPQGFNIKDDKIAFTINDDAGEKVNDADESVAVNIKMTLDPIVNYRIEENVPGTGTTGAMIFALVGATVIGIATILKRRNRTATK